MSDEVFSRIDASSHKYLEDLKEFLRIPSISALSDYKAEVARCAQWLKEHMITIGLQNAEVIPTSGHPVVYGEWMGSDSGRTILVYGHYDVQPPDPLDLWQTPPFEPSVREGRIYARGAVDDKGQVMMHLKAVQSLLEEYGKLPVNLKFIIEGEEEIGSPSLDEFLVQNKDRLSSEAVVISDTGWIAPGVPSITYALRGLSYIQVDVYGPKSDLHSGSYGGAVMNPAEAIARIIASLKDDKGRIKVDGFYDKVVELTSQEREEFSKLPFDEESFRQALGVDQLYGEEGYSTLERLWARPTLDVNGIWGGFTGEGSKTVIPAKAHAKISCRLVPDQDPEEISNLLERYIRKITPPGVRVEIQRMHGGKPAIVPIDHPINQAAARALEKAFGKKAVFIRAGGTIPVVASLKEILGLPSILMGMGLPDENAHAPNEWFLLDNFYGGIKSVAALWLDLGAA